MTPLPTHTINDDTIQTCVICSVEDTETDESTSKIRCDECLRWYHVKCVAAPTEIAEKEWFCYECDGARSIVKTVASTVEELQQKLEEQKEAFQRQAEAFKASESQRHALELKQQAKSFADSKASDFDKYAAQIAQKYEKEIADLRRLFVEQKSPPIPSQPKPQDRPFSAIAESTNAVPLARQRNEIDFFGLEDYNQQVNERLSSTNHRSFVNNAEQSFVELTATMKRQFIPKLPTFNGEEKDWGFFESCYDSSSLEGRFTEAENVLRLREALKSPAFDLVKDQLMFSTNASQIMSDLKKTYGRPDRLIVIHTQEILSIPALSRQSDPKLREFAIKMKNFVANMKALKREGELSNEYTLSMLVDKLREAPGFYTNWSKRKIANPTANLESFANFLMEKVDEMPPPIASFNSGSQGTSSNNASRQNKRLSAHKKTSPENKSSSNGNATSNRISSGSNSNSTTTSSNCYKCNENHKLFKCNQFRALTIKERVKFARGKGICFSCLGSTEHKSEDCSRRFKCDIDGCELFHNRYLHERAQPSTESPTNIAQYSQTTISMPSSKTNQPSMNHDVGNVVLFKILPVCLHGVNGEAVDTFAFLDGGSALTLLEEDIAKRLGLSGTPEELHLQWTKGITRSESSLRTSLEISGSKQKKRFTLNNVYTVKDIDLPEQTVIASDLAKKYPHLKGISIPSLLNAKPQILIGLDQAKFLLGSANRVGHPDDPMAIKTRLGWAVFGKAAPTVNVLNVHHLRKPSMRSNFHDLVNEDIELHNLVKNQFTTENFGIVPLQNPLVAEDVQRANALMAQTLKFKGDHYEIGLLWKEDNVKLPDSFPMATRRLAVFEKSLSKKPELLNWVNEQMQSLLDKGYARVASSEELAKPWPRVWYTPTFVVHNMNKVPPKPRLVADVAAKVDGESLNTNLLKGPDNLAPLLAGLFKFRENAIAVTADVREMFHQIKIREEDQQCQRILWRNGDTTKKPSTFIMQSMMFGPTCSPTCAQFVKNHHAKQFSNECPEAVDALINRTYVDDYNNSEPTVERANRVLEDATKICASMGFQLVAVQSNSKDLLKGRPESTLKDKLIDLSHSEAQNYSSKVLGLLWRAFADVFSFKLFDDETVEKMKHPDYRATKREVLRTLMRIYDPLGLIAHYLVRGRVVLQEIWRDGTGWDEEIDESLLNCWRNFLSQLKNIERLSIPRHYSPVIPKESEVELVVFVDASELAFAAVAYFRFSFMNETHVALVMGKAKVAPIKQLSIPQLELQAALLGVRLANTIKRLHAFEIHKTTFLADAKVVLSWLCSKKCNFKSFVAVRVGEILDSSTRNDWNHVRSGDNVADDATKWHDPSMGDDSTRWFRGPQFLLMEREQWPITPAKSVPVDEVTVRQVKLMAHLKPKPEDPIVNVFSLLSPKFQSRWNSAVRIVAFLLRFHKSRKQWVPLRKFVTPDEFKTAELVIFKEIQQEAFPNELNYLRANKQLDVGSRLLSLSPFLGDDGIIRMSSRAQKASISYASRNPVILPNKHPLVDLMIQHLHEENLHMAEETTIGDIRERAWVIDVRAALRRTLTRCQHCKISKAKPVKPRMGELPKARLDFGCKAFTHTGLDCFGPLDVKFGRGKQKRYGLIFTCLTYRAVHIELLNDLSTDECLSAIRRLITLRGRIHRLYSDNGRNFLGAKNQMGKVVKQMSDVLGEEVANRFKINWTFLPAYSPWMGGAWERLIGSIKRCIDFMLRGEIPHEHVLRNVLFEAQYQMNRRPLTHMPINNEDARPLTPNVMLFNEDEDEDNTHPGLFDEADAVSSKGFRRIQHLAQKYTQRWYREYLPEIARRTKWHKDTPNVTVDSVVILIEPNESGKITMKRGIVTRIYPAPDGRVRQADVRLHDGKTKLRRAVGNLAILDVGSLAEQVQLKTVPGMSFSDA